MGVEGQNLLPQPAEHTACDAAQELMGLLGYKHPLLAHVPFATSQHLPVLPCRAEEEGWGRAGKGGRSHAASGRRKACGPSAMLPAGSH